MYQAQDLWQFLPIGFGLTVGIETSVLLFALSFRHKLLVRLFCGVGLTAVTYPIVVLVLPLLIAPYAVYLAVAEIFAPLAECVLFISVFGHREDMNANRRDCGAIIAANVTSFLVGAWWFA